MTRHAALALAALVSATTHPRSHDEPGCRQHQRERVTDPTVLENAELQDPTPSALDLLVESDHHE